MVDAPVKLENSSEEKVHEDSTVGEKRNAPNSLDGPSAKRQRFVIVWKKNDELTFELLRNFVAFKLSYIILSRCM